MEHRDAEMAQVTVILRDQDSGNNEPALNQLRAGGLVITDVDNDDGVVEGTTPAANITALKKLPCVETLRITESWIADYSKGEARDMNQSEDADPEEPENWK